MVCARPDCYRRADHDRAGLAAERRAAQVEETPIGSHTPDAGSEVQRKDERDSLLVLARIKLEGAVTEAETVRVRNVSSGGLMAQTPADYPIGAGVLVELDGIGIVRGSVAWTEAGRIGIAFDHPINKARARKAKTEKDGGSAGVMIQVPLVADYRRPPLKPR